MTRCSGVLRKAPRVRWRRVRCWHVADGLVAEGLVEANPADRFDGTLHLAIYVLECFNQFPSMFLSLRRLDLGTGKPADADAVDVTQADDYSYKSRS